uniref:Uncharacterized protein n=1 Tax=Trichuris muris TaxID=70415 RepID=A0A5S6QYD3_TRIMR
MFVGGDDRDCVEHLLERISAEAAHLRELQQKLDREKRLFADLAVASRLKVESRTAGSYRSWPIECRVQVLPVADNSHRVVVQLKNNLHVALDRWKLLLDARPSVLFVGHSADCESCISRRYSADVPFLGGGAEFRHDFLIEDPFDGTAVIFDLFLMKTFGSPDHFVLKAQIASNVIHLFDLMVGEQDTGCGSRLLLEQYRCFRCTPAQGSSFGAAPSVATCSISFGEHLLRSLPSDEAPRDFLLRLLLPTLPSKLDNANGFVDVPLNHFNALRIRSAQEPRPSRVGLQLEATGFNANAVVDLFVEAALWRTMAFLKSSASSDDAATLSGGSSWEVEVSVVRAPSAQLS